MAFERFVGTGKTAKPRVSIWKQGQINFNTAAIEKYGLNNYKCAVLFYDREKKKIGLKFTNDEKEEGSRRFIKRHSGAWISARAFVAHYGIKIEGSPNFELRKDEKAGFHVLDEEK
jgi:hypothetical protein